MPANLADLIPEPDYYNLLGFLLQQKQKTEQAAASRGRGRNLGGPGAQNNSRCRRLAPDPLGSG